MQITMRLFTALCLAALTTASAAAAGRPAAAADPPRLYTLDSIPIDKSAQPADQKLAPDAIEEFFIEVDPGTVAANPKALLIDLPDLPPLEAVRQRFVVYRPDWKSWFGTLRPAGSDDEGSGFIHLGYHGQQITALIAFAGHHYRIVGGFGEKHRLARLSDDLSPPSCAVDAPAASTDPQPSGQKESGGDEPILWEAALDKATTRLDVLAVYPRAFFGLSAAVENGLFTFIQDSISLANQAFLNSNVSAAYNLVGIVPVTDASQPTTGIFASRDWLNSEPVEVVALRNAFGADIVTVFIPFGWNNPDYCGVANLPQAGGGFIPGPGSFNQRAYSANRDGCGLQDFTLGHEIGHNYGMHHDYDQFPDPSPLFPNGRGYVFTEPLSGLTKATVMGCYCTGCACNRSCPLGSGAVCNRVPYFSDPAIYYQGVPIGTSDRNNAHVGRSQVGPYSNFRLQSANTPPNANFNVSCAGRTCTFTSTSTDNAAIPSNGYWWDFGDNTFPGSGQTVSHTYATAGSYRVHLVVKDAGGQTDVVWKTAAQSIAYEGYHENANCGFISGWAWDTTPNDPINVDIYRDGVKVATVPANLCRQDLLLAGKGNGCHAFHYTPTSSWRDGLWHSATVRYGGTSTNLYWTPRSVICNARIFPPSLTPAESLTTGGQVYTVATQFSSTHSGYITRLGFHRAPGETGTNTLRLWTDGGTQLASVMTSCTSSGWCWASISPVAITAGTRYRVSVNTNTYQSKTGCGIGSGITNGPLTAHSGFWVAGNTFPTGGSCSNFFVDVNFDL